MTRALKATTCAHSLDLRLPSADISPTSISRAQTGATIGFASVLLSIAWPPRFEHKLSVLREKRLSDTLGSAFGRDEQGISICRMAGF